MAKLHNLFVEYPVVIFLVLTLLISGISFLLMFKIPGAQTPESLPGLPIWLIAIWSPNIAAAIIWIAKKEFITNIQLAFSFPKSSWWMLLALTPLVIASLLLIVETLKGTKIEWSNFKLSYILPLIFINLIMGPLGEELGWRAFLYPHIKIKYGWMASALFVGIVWAFWHAPLWFIDSPQSKIPFWAFTVNVVCLSILMSMVYNHSFGSVIPVILFHLTFNMCLGIIDILGSHDPGEYVKKSLVFYIVLVVIFSGIHELTNRGECSIHSM